MELSGRENIILNGDLQGITRKRMYKLMDDIRKHCKRAIRPENSRIV